MDFIFKHFGKLWVLGFLVSLLVTIGGLALVVWAVIKLVNHFTATPVAHAMVVNVLPYLS